MNNQPCMIPLCMYALYIFKWFFVLDNGAAHGWSPGADSDS